MMYDYLAMTTDDIKYKIDLEKYTFDLKYKQDLRGLLVGSIGLFILLVELIVRGEIQVGIYGALGALVLVIIIIIISAFYYLQKRDEFLEKIHTLFKKTYEQST